MQKVVKIILRVVVVNAFLILLFISTSYQIANSFNSYPNDLLYVHWSFFGFSGIYHAGWLVNGNFVATGWFGGFFDFPFWLFFVSTAVNLFFIALLLRENKQKIKQG
jgi:uncharacterized membrane protein YhdT